MSNVDKRVVEMQFNNKQFEKDMATTVKSLKNFEKSLEFKNSSKGLDNAAKSFSNIESKANNLDFSKFESSVNGISNRLSTMGIVAMTTIQNMATDVYNTIKGKFASLYDTVMGKGMSRALNLEQANFQLMGLLKNEKEVAKVMEDVDYAVSGTAYGLDEAAKVASQLAASNVTAGEYMKNSLRGISGVAAMTSSSYEEIGQIFTRVAGQGRVMATDLNSIAARGLNAAATLADFLGTSEEEVRDMVSKGVIDFKTFATAMDEAFGEHAKEANKTFTGAMQNVQAALGRVGAGFKQPYIKFMRPVLVQLIQNINAVKDAFGPLYDTTSFVYEKLSNFAISVLKNFVDFRKEGNKEISTINSLKESLQKMHDFIVGNWDKIANAINFVTIKILDFVKAFKPIGDIISFIFRDLFGDLVGFFGKLNKDAQNNSFITKLREDLTIFYGQFIRVWPEIKSIFSSALKILKGIFNFAIGIIRPIKEAFIESFPLKEFILLFKNVTNLFGSTFSSASKTIKIFTNDGNALKTVFTFLFNVIRVFISILNRLIPVIQKVSEAIFNFSNKHLEKVKESFIKLLSPVKKFKNELSGTNKSVDGSSKIFEAFNKVLEVSGNIFGGLFDSLKKIFKDILPILKKVGSVFLEVTGKIFDSIANITKNIDLDSFFKGGIIAGLIAFIRKIRKLFYKLDVGGLVGSLKGVLFQFKNLLIAYQREINAKALKELAIAIAILAGSLLVISAIPEKDLWRSVGAIGALFGELLGSFKLLSSTNGNFKIKDLLTIKIIASVMQDISVAVLVLAAALKVLSSLSWDELSVGLTGISVLLGEIIGVSRAIDKDAKKMQKTAKSMIYIAIAIRILASSAKIFSKFSWEELAKAGTAIAGLTGVFVGLSYAFNKKSKGLIKGSIAMLIFAESIKKLTKPLKELSNFSWEELAKAGTAIAGLTLILSGFSRLVKGGSLLLASTGMLLLAASLKSIVPNLKVLGSMQWEELGKAGTAIAGLTLILSGFSRLVKGGSLLLASTGMLLLAASLKSILPNLKVLGTMNWEELGKAGTAIAGLITIFTLFSRLAKPGSLLLLSASLVVLSSALSVFIIEMKALSDMGLKGIIVSLAGIAGVFTIIGVAGKKLKTTVPTILKLSTALLLIGAGFGIAGLGLSAFIGAIAAAGGTIKGIIDGIIDLFKAILDLIPHFFKKIGEGIAELIKVLVVMFTESFPDLLKAIGVMIDQLIPFILEYVPKLADAIIKLIIAVIDTVASNVPKIFNALKNLFASFFKALSQTGKQFKIEDLFWAINAVALIAGLIYILQVISSDMKSALKGIALMALVLGSIVGALVILNQFTNVDKTIDLVKGLSMALLSLAGVFAIIGIVTTIMNKIAGPKGTIEALLIGIVGFMLFIIATVAVFGAIGAVINLIGEDAIKAFETSVNVMSKVGQALGSFFGSIVSAFSTIIDNNGLTESMLLAMTPLILALEPLTLALPILTAFIIGIGATVEAIDEYFNGAATKGLENAIQIMPLIGEALGGFMGSLIGAAAKFASKGLAESITVFGDVLSSFMTKIQPFINGLSSISGKTLEQAGQLTLIVLEMCAAELITSITDFFTAFTGKRSLADFAKMLADMAPHLVEFSKSLKEGGFDGELANAAANCALTITNVLNNLPRENGLWQILAGTTIDMDTFGEQLKKFGSSMVEFAASVENITPEQANKIKILLPLVENLVEIANAMPKDGGFWQFLAGTLTDMDEFGEQISKFGISLNDFAKYTSNITIDQANKIKILLPLIEGMVDIANAMPKNNGFWQVLAGTLTGFDTFGEQLSKFGVSIDSFAKNTSHISESQISTMNNMLPIIESLVDFGNKMAEKGGKWQELFGTKQSLSDFGDNLGSLGEGIQQFAAYTALISQNNVTSANGALSVMKQIVDMSVLLQENGGIGGALGWLIGSGDQLKKFTDNLPSIGEALSKFAENTSDIDSAEGTQKVANAIKTIAEAFKMSQESGNIKEFIDSINSIANLSVDTIKDGFDKRSQELFDAAEKLVDNMLKGFESKKGSITISLASLMLVVKKTIESNTSAKDGLKTMLDKCVKEISNYTQANDNGDFYRTGKQAVDGFVKGVEDNLYKAVDAGRKIGKSALLGTQFSLDVGSPSKEYGKLAHFSILGFINEFAACSDIVFKSGQNLGNSAMNGTKSIIAHLDSAINSDMNLQPVISPVLDLSEVNSQAGLIRGILNAGTSYRIAGATSSLINKNNDNRIRTKIDQNRSPDVVEAVNNLTSRMDSLERAIIDRPIVMDGTVVTKKITPSIDRELGLRKSYSRRGI